MNVRWLRYLGYLIYLVLLFVPGWVFFAARPGVPMAADTIYPLFGLYAFTFVAIQMILGSNMRRLRPIYPKVMQFHRWQGLFALAFAFVHPLLAAAAFGPQATFLQRTIVPPSLSNYIIFGIIASDLMLVTVITAVAAWKFQKFTKTWRTIHLLNYLVFILAWVHSWFIGSDVQGSILKYVWIFYLLVWLVSVALRVRAYLSQKASAAI